MNLLSQHEIDDIVNKEKQLTTISYTLFFGAFPVAGIVMFFFGLLNGIAFLGGGIFAGILLDIIGTEIYDYTTEPNEEESKHIITLSEQYIDVNQFRLNVIKSRRFLLYDYKQILDYVEKNKAKPTDILYIENITPTMEFIAPIKTKETL